jgi:hypothetical protein
MEILTMIAIAIAINIVAYLIMPKPKRAKPEAAKDWDLPTAEAGRPQMVPFGTVTIKSPNVIYFGEPGTKRYEVKV